MRIASFNLENLSDANLSEARQLLLRQQFARLRADIVCLQEVDGDRLTGAGERRLHALETVLAPTPYADYHVVHTRQAGRDTPRDRHNLVVLSRWPIDSAAQYTNDLVPPPRYARVTASPPEAETEVPWDRPILHVRISTPDGLRLDIVNMHLKAPLASQVAGQKAGPFAWKSVSGWAEGYFLAAVKRGGQALEARLLVERIFDDDPEALVAVCGDFNAEEGDTAFRIITARTEDTGNGSLAVRELIALEHSLPTSQRYTVIHSGHYQMLDHIVVSRPLLAYYRGIEIHNETLSDEVAAGTLLDGSLESFHAPIVATFAVSDTQASGD